MRHWLTTCAFLLGGLAFSQNRAKEAPLAAPRVMVIFDNSRSMEAPPDNWRDDRYTKHDLDPKSLVNNRCDPHNPPALCKNKFCMAKCVLHNALDPYESLADVGFASFYNYLRRTESIILGSWPTTYCAYDVIAAPGEDMGTFWSMENNLHEPGRCTISQVGTPAHERSYLSQWGTSLKCQSTSGIPEPPKTCEAISDNSDSWFHMPEGQVFRHSAGGQSLRPYFLYGSRTGYGVNQVSQTTLPGYGSSPFFLFSQNRSTHDQQRAADCVIGEKQTFTARPSGARGEGWSTCTPDNPCDMTITAQDWDKKFFDTEQNPPPEGFAYFDTHGPYPVEPTMSATPLSSCESSQKRGDKTVHDCELVTSDDSDTLTNKTGHPVTQYSSRAGKVVTYTQDGSPIPDPPDCDPQTCAKYDYVPDGQECTGGFKYECGECCVKGEPVCNNPDDPLDCTDGDPCATKEPCNCRNVCQGWTNKTKKVCVAWNDPVCRDQTYTYVLKATWPTYGCKCNAYNFEYRSIDNVCTWQREDFDWRPRKWKYSWRTAGGEILQTPRIAIPQSNACSSEDTLNFALSDLATHCPATSASIHSECNKVPGRTCLLRWRSPVENYEAFQKGRGTNSVSAGPPEPLYCRAADHQNSPTQAPPAWLSQKDWMECRTNQQNQPRNFTDTFVMSDPYSPPGTPGAQNMRLSIGSPAPLGGTIQKVSYATMDATTWTDAPPLPVKSIGWSRLPQNHPADLSMSSKMGFLPMGPASETLPVLRQMMEVRTPENPLGLLMPTRRQKHRQKDEFIAVTGQNTPLFGSLVNVKDYLEKELLPNDSAKSCRTYSVILVTDGGENQPGNQPQHPGQTFPQYQRDELVSAIKSLRGLDTGAALKDAALGGVKTYVIGFGDAFDSKGLENLHAMAVAGGTAVDGKALTPQSPIQLKEGIKVIFSDITNNRYTRSKPLVAYTGDRMYVGAFRIDASASAVEWQGELNAYRLTKTGVDQTPSWEFHKVLNAQPAASRKVLTALPNLGQFNVNQMSMSQADGLYKAMGVAPSSGAEVLNFVLNPSKNARFTDSSGSVKTSRLSSVFHSSPILVGPPPFSPQWAGPDALDIKGYEAFKALHRKRGERIFVGSNTGMMHAVCEKTSAPDSPGCGTNNKDVASEVYAFIPPSVLPKLNSTREGTVFTVDGSFGVADVCFNQSCDSAQKWMSLLVGSMHKGGRSLYALNITDADKPAFLWEFTDSWLGETWSPPTVVKASVQTPSGFTRRWVGLLGGGVWPTGAEKNISNSVMVVDLQTGKLVESRGSEARFRVDSNDISCDFRDGHPGCLPRNSVPARLSVSRAGQSASVRNAFFGDTQGRMWSMSFQSGEVASWQPRVMFDPTLDSCTRQSSGAPTRIYPVESDPSRGDPSVQSLPFPNPDDPRPLYQRLLVSRASRRQLNVFGGTGDVNDPTWVGTGTTAKDYDYLYGLQANFGTGVCSGSPLWVKRLRKGEKLLSEGTTTQSVVFLPTFMPPGPQDLKQGCSHRGHARIYAFYQSTGHPARVFDPDNNPLTQNNTHILELREEGIISDLLFVADPDEPRKGRLVYATDFGDPRSRPVTELPRPTPVHSWYRWFPE